MDNLRHFTDEEIEAFRRAAVRACAEHQMAIQFNRYLDEYGIERVAAESWFTVLSRKLGKPFRFLPSFSLGAE